MLSNTDIALGTFLTAYGTLKVFVGATATFGSEKTEAKIESVVPASKALYGTDRTIAAKALEANFILFGVYSLMHGFDKFKLLPHCVSSVMENPKFDVLVYSVLGTFLTLFYALVVYTDVPIPKDKANISHYRLLGLVSGLSFLITVPFLLSKQRHNAMGSWSKVFATSGGQKEIGIIVIMAFAIALLTFQSLDSKAFTSDFASIAAIFANF